MTNRDVPFQDIPLIEKLKGWVETSGYPLEMRVARAFHGKGASLVDLAHLYNDPETGTKRDIDVIVIWERRVPNGVFRVRLTIECKTSKHPWVVFGHGRRRFKKEAVYALRAASTPITSTLLRAAKVGELEDNELLRQAPFVGSVATEAFTQGTDHAYAAAISAGKAALSAVSEANESFHILGALEICFPVVVLKGRMFECYLSDHGELEMKEVVQTALAWKRSPALMLKQEPMASFLGIMDIVTEDGLVPFVDSARAGAENLLEYLANDMQIHPPDTSRSTASRE